MDRTSGERSTKHPVTLIPSPDHSFFPSETSRPLELQRARNISVTEFDADDGRLRKKKKEKKRKRKRAYIHFMDDEFR